MPLLVGLISTLGSIMVLTVFFAILYFLFYTRQGRILLHRGRPGEYDDEQAFLREEEEGLQHMDDIARTSYLQSRAFQEANPPDSIPTDISLSQFMAIQEKGVSAWEFEPDFENANCFVEARTEIAFYDSECCVQTNLPVPKQNDVYYWEAKLYDKPEQTLVSIGMCTKPYPTFRLPGYHKFSVAYNSLGERRNNMPFHGIPYGPPLQQGDVVGVGFRPRTGTIFFTRNGKKLDDAAHGMKFNLFPTIGSNGPCTVHVNFGQAGFVFIEAQVKKWGLAPITGSLAPPPPYGAEQGSILLEIGRVGFGGIGSYRGTRSPFPPTESHDHDTSDSINMSSIRIVNDPSSSTAASPVAPVAPVTPISGVRAGQYLPTNHRNVGFQPQPPSNRPPSYTSDTDEQAGPPENAHLLGQSPPPAFEDGH
ncbi:concanavalin A-like lectin/glucanase domain-containing protein [Lipomyces doorenjongii]|uniref:concanavalin A-like lectin/glucanase domain-containing protein n=1 Tax=Lipomyces doorenjongii TaxID=383834 RepID=UPI0034D00C74